MSGSVQLKVSEEVDILAVGTFQGAPADLPAAVAYSMDNPIGVLIPKVGGGPDDVTFQPSAAGVVVITGVSGPLSDTVSSTVIAVADALVLTPGAPRPRA